MTASLILSTAAAGRRHVTGAAATMSMLLFAAGLALPFGAIPLAPHSGFLLALGGMMLVGDLVTAALLFSHALTADDRATADLGAAYLFSTLIIVPHLLAFPGVFTDQPIIGSSASAIWLWDVWHAGFALCVARYALRRGKAGRGALQLAPIVATIVVTVLAASLTATAGLPYLLEILSGGSFARVAGLGIGTVVIACNVGALVLVIVRLRGRTVVDLWLSVAMLAATLDVVLTLYGGAQVTLGWFVGRTLSLATGVTVLLALLSELTSLFSRISSLNEHLRLLSVTDGLTQIANRRGFDEALDRAWRTAERQETAISLLIVDIDDFKGFNDSYGHLAGDECLRRVASLINSHARRPYDIAARLGGEEFALLMPATEEAGAALIAERVRAGIQSLLIPHVASRTGHVTVSGGIATVRPCARRQRPAGLTEAADRALYRAKADGRNRLCTDGGAPEYAAIATDIAHRRLRGRPWQLRPSSR